MQDMFNQLKREVGKLNTFSIVCHKRPDGDAIGSVLAFSRYLEFQKKEVKMYCIDSVPNYFDFLEDVNSINNSLDDFWQKSDAIVILDCGDLIMPGIDKNLFKNHKLIVIDHHASNSGYADINIINPKASATTEILYNYFIYDKFQINKNIATHLLCGIYTDTDAFTNLGTTPESLRVSSELLAFGANFRDITAFTVRNKSIASLKLWGRALERLRFDQKNGLATTVIKKEDFDACNASPDDAEGVANLLNHLSGVTMSMVLRELSDGNIKGSLRTTSELIDVSQVAKLMGGGGHKKAAGFIVKGRIEETNKGWKVV